jgi:hypothetical protein
VAEPGHLAAMVMMASKYTASRVVFLGDQAEIILAARNGLLQNLTRTKRLKTCVESL